MNTAKRIILWLTFILACFIPASAVSAVAAKDCFWGIFSNGYDAAQTEVTCTCDGAKTYRSAHDTALIGSAFNEEEPSDARRALFCQNVEFMAADSAGAGIVTPYGTATQEFSAEALEAQQAAQNGATLYKGGVLGQSTGPEAQFWSLENPLSPGYAEKYGIPAENMNFDFIQTGKLTPGSNFITRAAPGVGANGGGAIEVVTELGGVTLGNFYMP